MQFLRRKQRNKSVQRPMNERMEELPTEMDFVFVNSQRVLVR